MKLLCENVNTMSQINVKNVLEILNKKFGDIEQTDDITREEKNVADEIAEILEAYRKNKVETEDQLEFDECKYDFYTKFRYIFNCTCFSIVNSAESDSDEALTDEAVTDDDMVEDIEGLKPQTTRVSLQEKQNAVQLYKQLIERKSKHAFSTVQHRYRYVKNQSSLHRWDDQLKRRE